MPQSDLIYSIFSVLLTYYYRVTHFEKKMLFKSNHSGVLAVLVCILIHAVFVSGAKDCYLICDQTNRKVKGCYDKFGMTLDVWDEYDKCYCGLGSHFVSCYSCTDSEQWAQNWLVGFDQICAPYATPSSGMLFSNLTTSNTTMTYNQTMASEQKATANRTAVTTY
ncbi:hypothetical protein V1512DRAFT_257712 [Lipomyces arxii]|uniref:uncharacterized protein n=1 Tax=Lipomyces arxii TaxID=56418 RepID=UPI0034CD20C1